jgi:hypothetical protein
VGTAHPTLHGCNQDGWRRPIIGGATELLNKSIDSGESATTIRLACFPAGSIVVRASDRYRTFGPLHFAFHKNA